MLIENKNIELDKQLYEDILYNYKNNIHAFETQNSGFIIDSIKDLTEFDILSFIVNNIDIEDNTIVDKSFINEHFKSFAINPLVEDIDKGYTNKVHIIPDIICESIK